MLLLIIISIVFVLEQPLLVNSTGIGLLSADELPTCNLEFNLDSFTGLIYKKICEIVKYNPILKDEKLNTMKHLLGQFLCENKNTEKKTKIQKDMRIKLKEYLHSKMFKIQSNKALEDVKKEESRNEKIKKETHEKLEEEKKLLERIECHLSNTGDELWLKSLLKSVLKGKNDAEKELTPQPFFIIITKIWEKFFDAKNGLAFKIVDIVEGEKQLPFDPLANFKHNKISRIKRQDELVMLFVLLVLGYGLLILIGTISIALAKMAPAIIFTIAGFARGMQG